MPNFKIFNSDKNPLVTANYAQKMGTSSELSPLSVDLAGNLNIRTQDSQFNRLITSPRSPLIELKSTYGISSLRDSIIKNDTANISNDGTEFNLSTGTGSTGKAILDSAERGRYIPGATCQAGIGVRTPLNQSLLDNQEIKWGYFDDNNGFLFGQDTTGTFIAIKRSGTIVNKVYQENWNGDKLDGTGPSKFTLDLTNGNIYQITYTWYGYGTVEFQIVMGEENKNNVQTLITVHRFRPTEETSVSDPNLPIRAEVSNNGTENNDISLLVGGRQYSIFSNYNPNIRITSEYRTLESVSNTTFVPTVTFKRKNEFPSSSGRANSVSVKLESIDILSENDALWEIRFNPTISGGTTTFEDISNIVPSETAVEVNTKATSVTGGLKVISGITGGGFSKSQSLSQINNLNLDFNGSQPVSLVVRNLSTSGNITVVFRVREEW